MNLIYLHGFQSSNLSIKGQMLQRYCLESAEPKRRGIQVHLPDLNQPPLAVMQQMTALIGRLGAENTALVGSSLGGFYALQLAVKHDLPAVLINPAMRPWALFSTLFSSQQLPYSVTAQWSLDEGQLKDLENLGVSTACSSASVLALLQQGDEVLDYAEALTFFSQPESNAVTICETGGNHGMDDFSAKIPMILQFLSDQVAAVKRRKM